MGLTDRIRTALPGSSGGGSDGAKYECQRCGATYDTLVTPCEECGNKVLSERD